MKNKPNLFDYATSELSQDAFLAWLIEWSDEKYKIVDEYLNQCAVNFVNILIGKENSLIIEKVQVGRQWNNIDVWALINDKYFIVIEDKKGSKEHSNQLTRYAEISKNHYDNKDIEIVLVYFKMQEQSNYNTIEKSSFKVFKRKDMINVLYDYFDKVPTLNQNNILIDYYEKLNSLDLKIKSFSNRPLNKWGWFSWQGFYSKLQNHINGTWDYVPNRAGGFLGFWWHHKYTKQNDKEFEYYIQLEEDKLVFKLISYNENNRREIRDYYRRYLYKKASEMNISISQFGRIGKHMGVARLNSEYRILNKNGTLDFEATLENLKKIMELVSQTEREITAHNSA